MSGDNIHIPEGVDITGKVTLILNGILFFIEKLSIIDVNNWILAITAIIGFIYIVVKVQVVLIEKKIKNIELKKLKKDEENNTLDK